MKPQDDPRLPIVALKGLPITIAALLCRYQQPISQESLCDLLDSTDKTMSKALHRLQEFQILSHCEEGWSVTANVTLLGFSLPVWLQVPFEPDVPVEKPVDTCSADTCPADGFPQEKGRKFSDPTPLTTSSTSSRKLTNLKLKKNLLPVLPVLESKSRSEPEAEAEPEVVNAKKFGECYKAALEAGIWEPKAKELAKMAHVTPELIKYHIEVVLSEKKEIPLAIYRIEHSKVKIKPQARSSQVGQDSQKYVTGKYADFINH